MFNKEFSISKAISELFAIFISCFTLNYFFYYNPSTNFSNSSNTFNSSIKRDTVNLSTGANSSPSSSSSQNNAGPSNISSTSTSNNPSTSTAYNYDDRLRSHQKRNGTFEAVWHGFKTPIPENYAKFLENELVIREFSSQEQMKIIVKDDSLIYDLEVCSNEQTNSMFQKWIDHRKKPFFRERDDANRETMRLVVSPDILGLPKYRRLKCGQHAEFCRRLFDFSSQENLFPNLNNSNNTNNNNNVNNTGNNNNTGNINNNSNNNANNNGS